MSSTLSAFPVAAPYEGNVQGWWWLNKGRYGPSTRAPIFVWTRKSRETQMKEEGRRENKNGDWWLDSVGRDRSLSGTWRVYACSLRRFRRSSWKLQKSRYSLHRIFETRGSIERRTMMVGSRLHARKAALTRAPAIVTPATKTNQLVIVIEFRDGALAA